MPYPDSTYEQQWRNARVHPLMRARDPHKAALLAAAPELLAALHETLGELEWLCECHRKCKEEPDAGAYTAASRARTAIAKAEGRDANT
jgi:hypothetical protein